jgi:hypothetical protein
MQYIHITLSHVHVAVTHVAVIHMRMIHDRDRVGSMAVQLSIAIMS